MVMCTDARGIVLHTTSIMLTVWIENPYGKTLWQIIPYSGYFPISTSIIRSSN